MGRRDGNGEGTRVGSGEGNGVGSKEGCGVGTRVGACDGGVIVGPGEGTSAGTPSIEKCVPGGTLHEADDDVVEFWAIHLVLNVGLWEKE